MQNRKIDISAEVVAESLRLARANQVPGQTKEQTQLIAQGIQKGIAEYKRAQKARQRLADKAKKQQRRHSHAADPEMMDADVEREPDPVESSIFRPRLSWLPWLLLLLTWSGIALVGLR